MIPLLQEAVDIGLMHKCGTLGCPALIDRKHRFCLECHGEGFAKLTTDRPSQAEVHNFLDESEER